MPILDIIMFSIFGLIVVSVIVYAVAYVDGKMESWEIWLIKHNKGEYYLDENNERKFRLKK